MTLQDSLADYAAQAMARCLQGRLQYCQRDAANDDRISPLARLDRPSPIPCRKREGS